MTLHNDLINHAIKLGWKKNKWKENLRKRISMRPWSECIPCAECLENEDCEHYNKNKICYFNENLEMALDCHVVPDAWKLSIVHIGSFTWPVLLIEVLEVIVSHNLTITKLSEYNNLWWRMDATDRLFFKLWIMDRYGNINLFNHPMEFGDPS